MNRTIGFLFFLMLSASMIAAPTRSQTAANDADGYSGTDFWICFPQNAMRADADGLQQLLYISSESRATGTIESSMAQTGVSGGQTNSSTRTTFTVQAGACTSIPIGSNFEINTSGQIERKSLHVTSDRPITVFAISRRATSAGKNISLLREAAARTGSTFGDPSTESYAVIPTSQLGREYMVLGYKTLFLRKGPSITSQAEIVATEDNTLVTAKLTAASKDGKPAGRALTIVMNRGDVFQLQGSSTAHGTGKSGDLTGSTVSANKPVAFFTGHQCAQAPDDDGFCTLLIEQEPPMSDWGTDFIFSKFEGDGDMMRLVASQDSTEVSVNGRTMATLGRGGYIEIDTFSDDATIHASKPVLVGQYSTTSRRLESQANDPLLVFTTPNDRFITGATTVPLNGAFAATGRWDHYLNIVVPDSALATLRIDGRPAQVAMPSMDIRHVGKMDAMTCMVSEGRHTVTCAAPIAVYSYGVGTGSNGYDSYGHNCGMRLDVSK